MVTAGISLCSGCNLSVRLFSTRPASFFTDRTLADPTSHEAHPWTLVWSLLSIALMQCTYWVSHHLRPPLPQFRNTLLGHVVLFLARMGFVLPTSVFGFVFVAQRPEFDIPVFQCLVLFLGLFSLYCYVRELERLGRVFIA